MGAQKNLLGIAIVGMEQLGALVPVVCSKEVLGRMGMGRAFAALLLAAGWGLVTPGWAGTGELRIEANGEDFIREGFVSKDGWALTFAHVKLHFAEVRAFQTDPPFDPDQPGSPSIRQEVRLTSLPEVVDLQSPEPVLMGRVSGAPAGFYNALGWQLLPSPALGGASILLEGTAVKGTVKLPFRLGVDRGYGVICGEYIGEERRGILQPGGSLNPPPAVIAHLPLQKFFDHHRHHRQQRQ